MRKILGIAIFMLTLLPVLNIGDASSLYAQNFSYENGSYWIPDVEVNGKHKVKCDCCKESFDDEEAFDRHLEHNYNCRNYYGIKDDNDNDKEEDDGDDNDDLINGYCYICRRPTNQCTCTGVECTGKNKNNPSTYTPTNSSTAKSKVSMTKLVSNFNASIYNRTYNKKTCGHCLRSWKKIWQESGIGEYDGTEHAKDFGPVLTKYGFKLIYSGNGYNRPPNYIPQVGDTRVWNTYPGQSTPSGHIDWWNGTHWVSDFVQQGKWIPGSKYGEFNVSYKIYR